MRFLFILAVLAAGFFGGMMWESFTASDACLDSGGTMVDGLCEHD